jgi:outer membrane receptor protein involved in Fe transport
LIVEHDTFDVQGRASETTQDVPAAPSAPSFYQVLANPAFNDGVNPGPTYDPNLDFTRDINSPDFSDNTIDTQTLRLDYQWNDFTITSLTGHLTFDYLENCDCDFTPANIFDLDLAEDYKQISQELRIASPDSGAVKWVAGVFYQAYDQTFSDDFNIPSDSLLPKALIAGEIQKINADASITDKATAIAQASAYLMTLAGAGISRDFEQSSDSWAIFGDVTWNITNEFNVKLGARFTEEKKDASKQLNVVDINNGHTPLTGAKGATAATLFFRSFEVDTEELAILPDATRAAMGAPSGHSLSGSRDESAFTPSLTLSYYPHQDVLTYAKISKGFKAGGFDPRSNNVDNFEFEEEKVLATEIGAKMGLAQGRGELNIALFKMDYDDLQVSQFDGKIGFNVGNAKDTRVQGLELDSRWQFSEKLSSGFGFTYLDFEYLDFENGNCHYPTPAPTSDGPAFCDYTGERGVYTPEYTVNGSLDYRQPIYGNMTLVSSIDAQWVDEQEVHVNLDPAGTTDAFTLLSMRIAVETEQWQVALLGQNLLDEEIITYSGNTPLAETIAKSNTHYSFVRRPRTVALTARINF